MTGREGKAADVMTAGEFLLGIEGLALIRTCFTEPERSPARIDEIRTIIERYDEFPYSIEFTVTEHDVVPGYTKWSETYDGPNPAIAAEEPVVHALIDALPTGDALDAACGTGRHAAYLAGRGHQVIGVDATDAMLDVARAKVPEADFRIGAMEALPVGDASVDLVTCALALTHVPDLAPVMREFARVLRPGGHIVLSDIHPIAAATGAIAGFPTADAFTKVPYVVNIVHHVSEYLAAFRAAGLVADDCIEVMGDDDVVAANPGYTTLPEACRHALLGWPYLLVWGLSRP